MAPVGGQMIISTFSNERDNVPAQEEVTWDQLAANMADVVGTGCVTETCLRHDCDRKKRAALAWCPAFWAPGVTRAKATVEEVSCVVLDLDDIKPEDLEKYLTQVEPYDYILHSSHSDRPNKRCVRVILRPSEPIKGRDFTRFWLATVAFLGWPVDPNCKDSSRLYYLPTRPRDACRDVFDGSGFDYALNEGVPFDVQAILATAPILPERGLHPVEIPDFAGAPSDDAFEQAVQALGNAWPGPPHRNEAHLALSGALARQGWPVELIAEFCTAVAEIEEPGNGDYPKRLSAARSSLEKLEIGEIVTGWPKLEEKLNNREAVDIACKALGVTSAPAHDQSFVDKMNAVVQAPLRAMDELVATKTETVPTRLEIVTNLKKIRADLKKSKHLERRVDGELLGKVIAQDFLTEHADEDRRKALAQAAVVVARAVPTHTPARLISELLLTPAGPLAPEVEEFVEKALAIAASSGPLLSRSKVSVNVEADEVEDPDSDQELLNQLELDESGRTRNCGHNIERILRFSADLRDLIRFNELSKEIEVTSGRFKIEGADGLPVGIKNWLGSHWSLNTSTTEVAEQLLRVTKTWCAYDPVAEYLGSLEWDGVHRLGDSSTPSWLTSYCNAEDTIYNRKIGTKFMISACARALDPGCKVDTVLILEGRQGLYKSTALSILGGKWFSDTPMILGDKDSRLLAACKWIIELGELKSLLRDDEASKQFLSQKHDDFRPPYGRVTMPFPRRCVFSGSTNEHEYLPDSTGNRRYWAVLVGLCDKIGLIRDRDQLWAEATYRYRTTVLNPTESHYACPGERWWFEPFEEEDAASVIASRRTEDPWVNMIKDWTNKQMRPGTGTQMPRLEFTMHEIAEHALQISPMEMRRVSKTIAQSMREAGFERGQDQIDQYGESRKIWVRKGSVVLTSQCEPVTTPIEDRPSGTN